MCGICGIFGAKDIEKLEKMKSSLVYRGPDSEGSFYSEDCSLGVRRLAIVDKNFGKQPITNENNDIWTVFNGEIYNFRQLKTELKELGHKFYTNSDTEVIIHLYEEHGRKFVNKLNGMFSIALFDNNKNQLFLYRDRLGIKPLFYCKSSEYFYFASEISPLIEVKNKKKPDLRGLSYFWHLRYIPAPFTGFKNIKQLEPGHMLIIGQDGVEKDCYWRLPKNNCRSEYKESFFAQEFSELLSDSVNKRIKSEHNIGSFISGGIDSSAILKVMEELSNDTINTYSAIFSERDHDERTYSRLISRKLGTIHSEVKVTKSNFKDIEQVLENIKIPIADPAIIPASSISKEASKDVKIVTTGTGSDEILGGYSRYIRDIKRYKICNYIPKSVKSACLYSSKKLPEQFPLHKYLEYIGHSQSQKDLFHYSITKDKLPFEDKSSLKDDIEEFFSLEEDYLSKMTRFDLKYWLPNMLLVKTDRCPMKYSIEARTPFLDHRLVEFSRKIPSKYKIRGYNTKSILKIAFSSRLPEKTINKHESGLSIPLKKWINKNQEYVSNRFKKERFEKISFIDEDQIMAEYQLFIEEGKENQEYLWKALILQIWYENNILSK